ncbi:hypothetical protein GGX14DRAFT_453804, partial [Mycena pura]
HTDRVAWNAHCERSITFKYHYIDSDTPPLGQLTVSIPPPVDLPLPELNLSIALWSKELMRREGELIMLAVECLTDGNFEAKWDATDMERKRELVLEGLYRGACNAQSDDIRADCPEMTVAGLAGNGEFSLIRMARGTVAPNNKRSVGHAEGFSPQQPRLAQLLYRGDAPGNP